MAFVKDYIPPLQSGSLLSSASQDEKLKKKDCPLDSTMRGGREGLTRVVDKFFFFLQGRVVDKLRMEMSCRSPLRVMAGRLRTIGLG